MVCEMLRQIICTSRYVGGQRVRNQYNVMKRNNSTVVVTQTIQDEFDSAKPYETIPGPKPLPIIGNVWRFLPYIGDLGTEFTVQQDIFYRTYGNIVRITGLPGRKDMVMIFDPDDIEKVYRNEGQWPKRNALQSLGYYRTVTRRNIFKGTGGALVAQGEEWHNFRRKVNPIMMHPKSTKLYIAPIHAVASDFIERIRKIRNDKLEVPPTFGNELCKWALESIMYIALDKRMGCLADDLKPDSETQKMIDSIQVIFDSLYILDFRMSPWKVLSTPTWRTFVKASDFFNDVCLKYIYEAAQRLNTFTEDSAREMTVLEKLLTRDSNPKTAMVMALDMMTAGIDTASFNTAVALYFLAKNLDKQDKLFKEINHFLPDKNQPITSEILNELKYLKACIKEGMRLQPIILGNTRTLVKDIVLSGYRVPEGVDIIIPNIYLCKMEKYFHKPEKYVPERWLKGSDGSQLEAKATHPFVFMPFGFGPRTCLGRRFAELEMETVISKIIRNFRVEYNYGEMKFQSKVLHVPTSPLSFKFEDRI